MSTALTAILSILVAKDMDLERFFRKRTGKEGDPEGRSQVKGGFSTEGRREGNTGFIPTEVFKNETAVTWCTQNECNRKKSSNKGNHKLTEQAPVHCSTRTSYHYSQTMRNAKQM